MRRLFLVVAAVLAGGAGGVERPRLAGTVIGPMERQAVIAFGIEQHGVAPGDEVAGWVVESIAPGEVVLIGPDGPLQLWVAGRAAVVPVQGAPFRWSNPCGRVHGAVGRHDVAGCRAAIAERGVR